MNGVIGIKRLRRLFVLPILLLGVLGCCTTTAFAAPQWEVSVSAENPFGEASFERESAKDLYKVTLKNKGNETAGGQSVGNTLECEGGPATATSLKYQWLRNGTEIATATSKSYVVTGADEKKVLQCEVLAANTEATTVAVSARTLVAPIPAVLPPAGATPSVTGTAKVGETLTCSAGTLTPTPEHYEYQWLRGGAVIAGSTSGSTTATTFAYTLVSADAGKPVQCEVVAKGPEAAQAAVSAPQVPVAALPASAAAPTITGVGKVGEKLTCTNSTWTGSPTEYEYQWLRNGTPISGARLPRTTAASFEYTLQSEDEKAAIQCDVTATSAEGSVSRASAGFAVGTLSTAPSVAPSITLSAAAVGNSLTCSHGTWSPTGTSYEFKWLHGGVVIAGTTTGPGSTVASVTYTPVTADEGKALQCEVVATNAGGSFVAAFSATSFVAPATVTATAKIPTSTVTLTDAMPKGIRTGIGSPESPFKSVPAGWSCEVIGASRSNDQCATSSDLVLPGETRTFEFQVITTHEVADIAENVVTVSGGGTSPASTTAEYPTTITPGEFGIESFSTSVVDELGTPFTQSTGHPFSATAKFVLNSTTVEQFGNDVKTAGGDPKNVAVELPPGFIGAPALEEQCTVAEMHEGLEGKCGTNHPNSAVGYIRVAFYSEIVNKTRVLEHNQAGTSSLVYNLAPPAGSAAAFGFTVSAQQFFLVASVRSDGDYGVTITSVDTPYTVVLLGTEVTFCGYGAEKESATFKTGAGNITRTEFACKGAKPGEASFLSNPASCTGSVPTTTLRVDSWEHPNTYVSKTVYTGTGAGVLGGEPSALESLVTGCDRPTFEPKIAPVSDTTQADAPTGLAVNLKVPQENTVPALASGQTLGCVNGPWFASPTGFAYQWLHSGAAISGATSQSYTIIDPSEASSLQCEVVATNAGGGAAGISKPAEASGALPARPATGPTITGGAKEAETLKCATGTWTGSPTSYGYQWLRNGAPIVGATSSEYTVAHGDVSPAGSVLQCVVTATNGNGSVSAVSANKNTTPEPTEPPLIGQGAQPDISMPPTAPGTPEVKNVSVTFPPGLSLSPSAADGLAGCSDAQFAVHSLAEAECPEGSKIGTVKIETPLLTFPLEGQLFLGQPLCGEPTPCTSEDAQDGRMFRLFIQAIDPENGIIVKVPGSVSTNPATGQFTASFLETPQLPFEHLELKLKNGPRAPLATPQTCGAATTTSVMTPWSTSGLGGLSGTEQIAGTADAVSENSFNVDWDGKGGVCPETLPFAPGFSAGTTSTAAAARGGNALSVSLSREDREQNLGGIVLHTPEGLLGAVSELQLCGEPQAGLGTCGAASRIGSVTASAGPGANPYSVTGSVYLTESYKGAPFGLSIVVPTKAGPFNLGNVVVRGTVAVDPHTAELTVTSDPFPQILDGIPLRLRNVNVSVDREGFILNPSSCAPKQITATITGAPPVNNPGEPVKSSNVSSSFDVGNCASLAFNPSFAVSTQGKTSRADGASLTVNVGYPQGSEANIRYLKVELPKQLPSRLTTLQKACTDTQFEANPAGCPVASVLGTAVAVTPVLSEPLTGPAYFVSHGGAAFPDLEIVLQGEGVTVVVDGATFISKQGITSTTFSTVPDAPISSFQVTLPEGPDSALAANGNLCTSKLVMPTTIIGQNGKEITQQTKIAVTGCPQVKKAALTRAQKLKAALKACKKDKSKSRRSTCEKQARKKYGPIKKKSKAKSKGKKKGK